MKFLKNNHRSAVIAIAATAIVFRICLSTWYDVDYLPSDGIVYHNLAVNIVSGNGYSKSTEPPFEPYFFREPAYPFFVAGIYGIYAQFGNLTYLQDNREDIKNHPEILWVKIIQSLISSVTCIWFYGTLILILKPRIAFLISMAGALYVPLAIFSTFLLRETFQAFVIVGMNYFFARLLLERNRKWLIAFSVALGISALTLRVTIIMPVLTFIYFWIYFKDLKISLAYTAMVAGIMLVMLSPWLIRTYLFYPDWRILRSVGTSHTFEVRNSYLKLEQDLASGFIDSAKFEQEYIRWKALSEKERFERSFSGYFSETSVNGTTSLSIPAVAKTAWQRWRMAWLESLWVVKRDNQRIHLRPHSFYKSQGNTVWLAASFVGLLFGYMALPGIIIFFRRTNVILVAFIYFYALFYLISNDPRRMLPVHLFVFLFSCLGIYYVYCRVRKKDPNEIFNQEPGRFL